MELHPPQTMRFVVDGDVRTAAARWLRSISAYGPPGLAEQLRPADIRAGAVRRVYPAALAGWLPDETLAGLRFVQFNIWPARHRRKDEVAIDLRWSIGARRGAKIGTWDIKPWLERRWREQLARVQRLHDAAETSLDPEARASIGARLDGMEGVALVTDAIRHPRNRFWRSPKRQEPFDDGTWFDDGTGWVK